MVKFLVKMAPYKIKMVVRRNCWKLGSVHHPALRDRSAVSAVYFELKVYMVV